jgi:4-aminobutyrate aminotransferase-like enzyme
MFGADLPSLVSAIPGPTSRAWVDRLAARECPAITARRARRALQIGATDTDPVVWVEAAGANVRDVDGNVFVDLTAGFGVAAVGHRNPRVVEAVRAQTDTLLHAMGDAFPDPRRIELMEALTARTGMDRVILGTSGSDTVDAAVKTAVVATGRARVHAFDGGYHGLAFGPLAALGYLRHTMRQPFAGLLGTHVSWSPFGGALPDLSGVGAVLVEPVQGRGGMRVPPAGWIEALHAAARAAGALVIHDEIYSGCGRTGPFLAAEAHPDLLCLGKALGGGFPVSACLGTAAVMDAWQASTGAAIHTQTFLGHPVGCAAALAALAELDRLAPDVPARSEQLVRGLIAIPGVIAVSGRGLMLGVTVPNALQVTHDLLDRGYLVLPCGERGDALGLTPPYALTAAQADGFLAALADVLKWQR